MSSVSTDVVEQLLAGQPFGLAAREKRSVLLPELDRLTRLHYDQCDIFRSIVDVAFGGLKKDAYADYEDLPFVPVSLFKRFDIRSVPREGVFKVLTSSGTSGQPVSRVYLDRETAARQAKALVRIVQQFLGKDRMPMVILDHPGAVTERETFSARGAGILGLMQFGRRPIYALNEDMSFDYERVEKYIGEHAGQRVLFFGFTFMAWQHAIAALEAAHRKLPTSHGVLIHSGGWKKLEARSVDSTTFDAAARRRLGVDRVINFYGMAEQVGSVFFENPGTGLHAPVFAHVIVRDPFTLLPMPAGKRGLVQVLSVLPSSYPGHSLLTADTGQWLGEDAPGLGGRYFRITGRAPSAEVRGCSDTYEQRA